jgi:RNA polymerase sigma-70 factor (ECF subfamily)
VSSEHGPAFTHADDLGELVAEPIWLEPFPDPGPEATYEQREGVELAFVHALQALPGNQRAVLIMRDVLGFSAAEVAGNLETSVASINSALQRARKTVEARVPARSQREELNKLGDAGQRALVDAFITAWEGRDVDAMLGLLAEDANFSMPPFPAWFSGRPMIRRFLEDRLFEQPWRVIPTSANEQLAVADYIRHPDGTFPLGSITVITVRDGLISDLTGFIDDAVHKWFAVPAVMT